MQHYEERLNKVKALLNRFNLDQLLIQLPSLAAVAESCACPITGLLLEDPVTASDGHTYERKAIEQWIAGKLAPTNPMTNKPLEKFGTPSHYFQSNWALRDVLVTLRDQIKAQIPVVIAECFRYIADLKQQNASYASFLIQQLLRGILRASPGHAQASQELNTILNDSLKKEYHALLAIYGGTFMRLHQNPPDEVTLLTLFLHYMTLMMGSENTLFSLKPDEKVGVQRLLPVLEQWLQDAIEVQSIAAMSDEKLQKIQSYATRLHERLGKQSDFLIIPSGFSRVNMWASGANLSPNSKEHYAGPSASASIIQRDPRNTAYFQWTQIDPFSPYHQTARTLTKTKRSIALEMQSIMPKHVTPLLLEELISLKAMTPTGDHCYRPEHLYEIILARLEGETHFKDKADHLFKTSRENSFCSSWYAVKDVFYYLLTQCFEPIAARDLYKKMICGFQADLLIRVGEAYQQIDVDSVQNQQYGYLLHEMCAKVAANGVKLDSIKKKALLNTIEKTQVMMKAREALIIYNRSQTRSFQDIYQAAPHFKTSTSAKKIEALQNNQFIVNQINRSVTTAGTLPTSFVFPVFDYSEDSDDTRSANEKIEYLYSRIDTFLKTPNLTYRLNYTYQISLAIETAILSLCHKGIFEWFDGNAESINQVASGLLKMGQLYYSAACRMASEPQNTPSEYNPVHYGKLLVITHCIYAMLDVLAKKDESMSEVLKAYQLNTTLNNQLSFNSLWKELILPDRTWVRVLSELKRYFDSQQKQRRQECDLLLTVEDPNLNALSATFASGYILYLNKKDKRCTLHYREQLESSIILVDNMPEKKEEFKQFIDALLAKASCNNPAPVLSNNNAVIDYFNITSQSLKKSETIRLFNDDLETITLLTHHVPKLPQLFSHGAINNANYKITFLLDADERNENVKCALTLLKRDPVAYEKFQQDFQTLPIEKRSQQWAALFFGKASTHEEYLPLLFTCLRDMAYYAHVSLRGVTEHQTNLIKAQFRRPSDSEKRYFFPAVRHWSQNSEEVYAFQSLYSASDRLQITFLRHRPTHYVFPIEKISFQKLLYPDFPALENHYIAHYNSRPESLSPSQYLTLSFIRTNLHLKPSRLYLALKSSVLSLDSEEYVYLIKQALLEVSDITWHSGNHGDSNARPLSFLERRFKHHEFADIFVQLFIDLVMQAKERLSQYRLLGHMMDILVYLHSFTPEFIQKKINNCFAAIRESLINKIEDKDEKTSPEQKGILSAYVILTYQTQQKITLEDIHHILHNREIIEENVNALIHLPSDLYALMMHVLLSKRECIEKALKITSSLYQNDNDVIDIMRGRRYINNIRVGGLSKSIIEHADFRAAFDNAFLLYDPGTHTVNQRSLVQYTSKEPTQKIKPFYARRITLLDSSNQKLWLEEQQDNGEYQTFVPHYYLVDILPKGLIEKYTHWSHHDQMDIKNAARETKFRLNLINGAIHVIKPNGQPDQCLLPFHNTPSGIINKKFWEILTAFEDAHHILILGNALENINEVISATTIILPRFSLSFMIQDNHIISNDYKDYCLAPCQQIETLLGISNYLVIESTTSTQRKVIIGHRHASNENTPFYNTAFKLELTKPPHSPSYFTYTIDKTLGTLRAETTSGKLYLAWLFFKTASLAPDPLTQLNGYEMAAELLKTCWQNVTYDALELDIILRFFFIDNDKLKDWQEKRKKEKDWKPNEKEIALNLEESVVLRKEQHRNAIAILLRVLCLMNESLETHFLHKKDSIIQLNKTSDHERSFYLKTYGVRYFLYYLNVKNRVHEKCLLSLEEERKFLRACRELFKEDEREHELIKKSLRVSEHDEHLLWPKMLEDYLMQLENANNSVVMPVSTIGKYAKHYKDLLLNFSKKEVLNEIDFSKTAEQLFLRQYNYSALSTKNLPKLIHLADWVDFSFDFDMQHFIALYQLVLSSQPQDKERIESLLNIIIVKKQKWWEAKDIPADKVHEQKDYDAARNARWSSDSEMQLRVLYLLVLRMLYIVVNRPNKFQSAPFFLFSTPDILHLNQSFCLSQASRCFSKDDFLRALGDTKDTRLVLDDLWVIFEKHFTEQNFVNHPVIDIEASLFLEKIKNILITEFAEKNKPVAQNEIANQLITASAEKLKTTYLTRAKNKELFAFFMDLAKTCDTLKAEPDLGKTVTSVNGIYRLIKSPNQVITERQLPFILAPEDALKAPVFSAVALPEIEVDAWFSPSDITPENRPFPLDSLTLSDTEALSDGFGNVFITELRDSYNSYLLTTQKHYRLLPSRTINDLENHLREMSAYLLEINDSLWRHIHLELLKIPETAHGSTFALSRHAGQQSFYTKSDTLRAMMNPQEAILGIQSLLNENPFLANHIGIITQRLRQYIQGEIQRKLWERTLDLIIQYKALTHTDECIFLEQEIAKNLAYNPYDAETKNITELLFELENNLIIRDNQRTLVEAMIQGAREKEKDPSKAGLLFQMNMGDGKTAVVLILLIQALADGNRLARANVLEPLMGMMKDLLAIKFGGLLRKRIYQLPFSRDVVTSSENLIKIDEALNECRKYRHVLLMTPEHRLCLQLKRQEKFLEHVQFKEADDTFHWGKYQQACDHHSSYFSQSASSRNLQFYSQEEMKTLLMTAGCINDQNTILKCPEERHVFWIKMDKIARQNKPHDHLKSGFYEAYNILQAQTVSRREEVQKQSQILTKIENINSCDILDESDEILRYGTELNYTLGSPEELDGKKLRWTIPSMLLSMLFFEPEIKAILLQNTSSVVWKEEQLRFTNKMDSLLKRKLAEKLLAKVAEEYGLIYSSFSNKLKEDSKSIGYSCLDFILGKMAGLGVEKDFLSLLRKEHNKIIESIVLLIKAWLSHEILNHVMSRRYRVEFGLDAEPGELPHNEIAIPFKGQDNPSPRSEFSHPDVMIGLTILSYYYQGLHIEQLKQTILALKQHAKRDEQLQQWYQGNVTSDLPDYLSSFTTLDLESPEHLAAIKHFLSRNTKAIHYYLNNIVFPEKAKYYKEKITGNAHTLAGASNTTGFSGTDDRKDTLPATVESKALEVHTNGKMIHLMTRVSNRTYHSIQSSNVKEFLNEVADYTKKALCYALIDAGAMTAGMNNHQVARYLLKNIHSRFQGVVFFDDLTGRILVLMDNDKVLSLATCHLDKSVLFVYFDEVHTRGSDLKLPLTAYGIVTLCRGMNKDKLMQAMMRLRQLEYKQSVCFWGPAEVSAQIVSFTNVHELNNITSNEVLAWVAYNTIQKVSADLYPVTLQKLEYVIKRRALLYQEANLNQPITALIGRFVDSAVDELEKNYSSTSVVKKGVDNILQVKSNTLQSNLKTALNNELNERELLFLSNEEPVPSNFTLGLIIRTKISGVTLSAFDSSQLNKENALLILPSFQNEFEEKCEGIRDKMYVNQKIIRISENDFIDFVLYAGKQKHIELKDELKAISFLATLQEQEKDFDLDGDIMGNVLSAVKLKLPSHITHVFNLEADQEKEKETEREKEAEVLPPEDRTAQIEEKWDSIHIFDEMFVANSINLNSDKKQYPQLLPLRDCLQNANSLRDEVQNIQWPENILATRHFIQTVNVDAQRSQDDYLRPADALLVDKKSETTYFILLSGAEANEIRSLYDQSRWLEGKVFLIHLSDTTGNMTVPPRKMDEVFSSQEEQYARTILKLFNGECDFLQHEEVFLNRALGVVVPPSFIEDEINADKSAYIYNELISKKYLHSRGLFSTNLTYVLNNNEKLKKLGCEFSEQESAIRKRLFEIQRKSIGKPDGDGLTKLPTFFKHIVTKRGNAPRYLDSMLGKKIG